MDYHDISETEWLELLPCPACITDDSGFLIDSNRLFRTISTVTSDTREAAQTIWDYLGPSERSALKAILSNKNSPPSVQKIKMACLHQDNVRQNYQLTIKSLGLTPRARFIICLSEIDDLSSLITTSSSVEEVIRVLADVSRVIMWIVSPDWRTVHYVNPVIKRIYGFEMEEFYHNPGLWLDRIYPDDRKRVDDYYRDHHGRESEQEYRIVRADGEIRWIRDVGFPVYSKEGELLLLTGLGEDITERKSAEARLQESLAEKEVLLREVNHRVKNNLQLLTSLLRLQMKAESDSKVRQSLHSFSNRLVSMAIVHQKLYQLDGIGDIDLQDYFRKLVEHLLISFGHSHISLEVSIHSLYLDLNRTIVLGLIVNELVSNSLQHAFDQEEPGKIMIHGVLGDNGKVLLRICDDGSSFDFQKSIQGDSFGLKLVELLCEQLEATCSFNSNEHHNGTTVALSFPKDHQE